MKQSTVLIHRLLFGNSIDTDYTAAHSDPVPVALRLPSLSHIVQTLGNLHIFPLPNRQPQPIHGQPQTQLGQQTIINITRMIFSCRQIARMYNVGMRTSFTKR